jgi:hypothetical protein
MASTMRMVADLTTGLKVSSQSTLGRCVKPQRTQQAFKQLKVPSERLVREYRFAGDDVGSTRPGNKFLGSIAH